MGHSHDCLGWKCKGLTQGGAEHSQLMTKTPEANTGLELLFVAYKKKYTLAELHPLSTSHL